MVISSIQIERFKHSDSKLKGVASIILDDIFIITNIKILEDEEKLFLGMPSKKMTDGSFSEHVHPINNEMRQILETLIFAAYQEAKEYNCLRLNASLRSKYKTLNLEELNYEQYLSNNPYAYMMAI